MIYIKLTASDMGSAVTPADFDRWAEFVERHLGHIAFVDQYPFDSCEAEDTIYARNDDDIQSTRALLADLWDDWCRDGA